MPTFSPRYYKSMVVTKPAYIDSLASVLNTTQPRGGTICSYPHSHKTTRMISSKGFRTGDDIEYTLNKTLQLIIMPLFYTIKLLLNFM